MFCPLALEGEGWGEGVPPWKFTAQRTMFCPLALEGEGWGEGVSLEIHSSVYDVLPPRP